ncbi:hypothetical protein [Streptomyces sp. NPDC058751]|uniref:hypothetical protein n=1 Tax=Streptomyces sp. NPDC058751 TaxID=3346623 RepID=UPI00369E71F4
MAPTWPHRAAGRPPATRTAPRHRTPPPRDAAQHAAHLEALLGDPREPANPYGRPAVWAAAPGALPAPPAGLPGAGDLADAGRLARALRPLFRRDLALAHAWILRPLPSAPVPHPAAALLGPAALLAGVGALLRAVTRVVDGLSRHEPAAGQWRPVLASVFADLLACESLTAVALSSCPKDPRTSADGPGTHAGGPPPQPGELLAAAAGYLVPQLAGDLLNDLELVLEECGFGGDTPERHTLARILRDRSLVGGDQRAAGAAQTRLVRALDTAGGSWPDDVTRCTALFWTTAGPAGPAAFAGPAVAPRAGDGEDGTAALARLGRRLAAEQRALRVACAAAAAHEPADPAARALADRRALLLLAAATTGVQEAAAASRLPFLGEAGWALLALARITGRLGAALPDHMPDAQPGVWDELARRAADAVDCDLYATGLSW